MEISDPTLLHSYCTENLNPLLEYDKAHNSSLSDTLKTYFLANCHVSKTAEKLYIHKNTLLYRMSIIKKGLDYDLTDSLVNLELFTSLLILEFIEYRAA